MWARAGKNRKDPQVFGCGSVVLLGVGAIGDCMAHMAQHELLEVIREVSSDRPFRHLCGHASFI